MEANLQHSVCFFPDDLELEKLLGSGYNRGMTQDRRIYQRLYNYFINVQQMTDKGLGDRIQLLRMNGNTLVIHFSTLRPMDYRMFSKFWAGDIRFKSLD